LYLHRVAALLSIPRRPAAASLPQSLAAPLSFATGSFLRALQLGVVARVCPQFPFVDTHFTVHTPIILTYIVVVHTVGTGRLPFRYRQNRVSPWNTSAGILSSSVLRVRRLWFRQTLMQLSLHVVQRAIRPRKECLDGLPILGEYGNSDTG